MNPGRIGCELSVLALFCVLAIFLFPAVQGPYSVVNGPVTALQAARAAIRLQNAITQAASRLLGAFLVASLISLWGFFSDDRVPSASLFESETLLRC
jgi:hypothetical protein